MTVTMIGGALVADDELLRSAAQVSQEVESHGAVGVSITTPTGEQITLDPEVADLMVHVLSSLSKGPVSITGLPAEVTTTIAADMLGISRPTLMKRIARGDIESRKAGSHTRLRTNDVLTLREQDNAARKVAFEELRRIDEELDILQ